MSLTVMITSLANDKVTYARSLQRRRQRGREGRFLVEGLRLVQEAMRAGYLPALLFFQPERANAGPVQTLVTEARETGVPCYPVSDSVLRALTDTVTPQPLVAVVPQPSLSPPAEPSLLLVLDRLRDPGNLGTILRTAVAAGVDEVLLAPGTVEPYNPKVVRAGMGAHFRLPMAVGVRWPEIAQRLAGLTVWLADSAASLAYDQLDWCKPSALIVGGEAAGAGDVANSVAQGRVHIPMCAETESLNAAVATAIILFEAARQRRSSGIT